MILTFILTNIHLSFILWKARRTLSKRLWHSLYFEAFIAFCHNLWVKLYLKQACAVTKLGGSHTVRPRVSRQNVSWILSEWIERLGGNDRIFLTGLSLPETCLRQTRSWQVHHLPGSGNWMRTQDPKSPVSWDVGVRRAGTGTMDWINLTFRDLGKLCSSKCTKFLSPLSFCISET